jgi:hypothetical protein
MTGTVIYSDPSGKRSNTYCPFFYRPPVILVYNHFHGDFEKEKTMITPTVEERFRYLHEKIDTQDYNFAHFQAKYGLRHAKRTVQGRGIMPGAAAPDFKLPTSEGKSLSLSDLRGKPVLLTFGSLT